MLTRCKIVLKILEGHTNLVRWANYNLPVGNFLDGMMDAGL